MSLSSAPVLRSAFVSLCLSLPLVCQVTVKRGAVVFHGCASNTSAPAIIQEGKVRDATREWQKIQSDGVDVDSAQGKQLIAQMNGKIRDAVKAAATAEGRDMVARKGDITDAQGRDVVDLTDKVIAQL